MFWKLNPKKLTPFIKAHEMRQERKNHELWLQGVYVYEALCRVSPVLNAFAKQGTKPIEYLDKPYQFGEVKSKQLQKQDEKQKIENERLKAQLYLDSWVKANSNKSQPDN